MNSDSNLTKPMVDSDRKEKTLGLRRKGDVSRTRTSRDQETYEKDDVRAADFDAIFLDDSGPLPEIPPRPGYVQRWVRTRVRNDDDARNLSIRARRGWQPRMADTVDKSYHHMVIQNENMGGIIGTHSLVLMERPMAIHRKAEQIERNKVRDLERAVRGNLFREHQNMGGNSNGMVPHEESTANVERGSPRVLDD